MVSPHYHLLHTKWIKLCCCSHDTQSSHWDSPRGMRQQTHITDINSFVQEHKDKLKVPQNLPTNLSLAIIIDHH